MSDHLPKYPAPQDGLLSPEMIADYRESGVLILRDFADVEACAALRQRALEMADAFDPASVSTVFSTRTDEHQADDYFAESGDKIRFFLESDAFDGSGQLRQAKEDCLNKMGHAMHDLDPAFDAFSRTPKLAQAVRSIGFQDPAIIQSMYIFKPPRIGGEVVCHQDSAYIYTEPESCVGFWFALEDATVENGCMYFIPGGHKSPLRKRNHRFADGRILDEILDETPYPMHLRLPAEAPAGTLVIFNGRTPHMSGPNTSSKSRHAYTLHVIDRACHYPEDNWLQRSDELPLRGFEA
ncbi:MAG: phytanoyl-CoA dioxygenase family protein [Woeseiaceae bacterium]|nr:phytanoyl-CoA dioxygenase family protein [Woeseiaceae bacterium]NIP21904.1 phytanoyl-CoA dioxygenase family protein [Woeseiaceae bacterium]NIS90989.1 phytanoyl-CoA dioxygenase family protein [Woeseiaceae bacterium]